MVIREGAAEVVVAQGKLDTETAAEKMAGDQADELNFTDLVVECAQSRLRLPPATK
jgi:hypothetical protein